jgi:hypothetical protein
MEAVAASGCTTDFRTLVDDSIGGIAGGSLNDVVAAPNTKADCEAHTANCRTTDFRTLVDDSIGDIACVNKTGMKIKFNDSTVFTKESKITTIDNRDEQKWCDGPAFNSIATIVAFIFLVSFGTVAALANFPLCSDGERDLVHIVDMNGGPRRTCVKKVASPRRRFALIMIVIIATCNIVGVVGFDPVPNGDGSSSVPGTGLRKVVSDWTAGGTLKDAVVAKYGEIENWGTSEVTNLAYVFYGKSSYYWKSSFNADISKWVVSSVTSLERSKSCLANC